MSVPEEEQQHLRVLIANERRDRLELLRGHSQHNGRKLVDIAQAIVDSHLLLLSPPGQPATAPEPAP